MMPLRVTHAGTVRSIPNPIRKLNEQKNAIISEAIEATLENLYTSVNPMVWIDSTTPDFLSVTTWDRYAIDDNGIIHNTEPQKCVNDFIAILQGQAGDRAITNDSYNIRTIIIGFAPLKEALTEIAKNHSYGNLICQIGTLLMEAEKLHVRCSAYARTAQPRLI